MKFKQNFSSENLLKNSFFLQNQKLPMYLELQNFGPEM